MDAHFAVSFQIQHLHRTFARRMAVAGQQWQEVVGVALTSVHVLSLERPAAQINHPHLHGRQGRFLDNIFVERLWRSMKYECLYLHAWVTGSEARAGIA